MNLPELFRKKDVGYEMSKRTEGTDPSSGMVEIKGNIIAKKKALDTLSGISAIENVEISNDEIRAQIVESTDRNKKPYLYVHLRFTKDKAIAEYSITSEVPNPDMRRISVLGTLLSIISILESKSAFWASRQDVFEKATEAIEFASKSAPRDHLRLRFDLEKCLQEASKLKVENNALKEEKDGLVSQVMEMERQLQDYEERVSSLERMTDGELDSEILKWVEEHGGELNDVNFCGAHSINRARLGERLDSLSKRGVVRFV